MKTILICTCSVLLAIGAAGAQNSQTSAQPQPQTPAPQAASSTSNPAGAPTRIAPGSVIPVSLSKTIDAKKVKTGDQVVTIVTQDMKTTSGNVLMPKDTKVIGHVTEAQPRNKEQKESQLGIAFDRAVLKDGNTMQMPMSIQAIIGPQNNQNNPSAGNSDAAASNGSPSAGSTGGRPGMGGSTQASTPSTGASDVPSDSNAAKNTRPPITAQTQGVVGISNLTLAPAATGAAQGSVVTSEKNNVKLESGTMMLLRVNQ
jgi:hypothetical protein